MFNRLTRTLVKVVVASLIVGTILAHFGITAGELIKTAGLSSERLEQLARDAVSWAAAEPAARLAGDRADLVRALSVPAAG